MFKVNNKDTENTSFALTYFTTCSNVFLVNFEHVTGGWLTFLNAFFEFLITFHETRPTYIVINNILGNILYVMEDRIPNSGSFYISNLLPVIKNQK